MNALTALLAVALPCAAQTPRMESLRGEMTRHAVLIEEQMKSLQGLERRYTAAGSVDEIAAERERLRSAMTESVRVFDGLLDEFKEEKQMFYVAGAMSAVQAVQKDRIQAQSQDTFGSAMSIEDFYRSSYELKRRLRRALGAENAAYELTASAQRSRRRVWGALAAGALLLVPIAFAAAQRRRAPPLPPPAITAFPTAGSALSSGPVGAALSGPVAPAARPAPGSAEVSQLVIGGNYRIDKEIGRGGMGLVYEALDLTLQRKVAVKRMKPELTANDKELDMFLSEARLVASLRHPGLVGIHAILREGPEVYLVFEFVAGKTLAAVLESEGRLAPARAALIVRRLAEALDYAHSRQVIHRDLKPANIMAADDGAVKLMDFGIAHQAKKTVAKMTRAAAWGTPAYMAPEQELGTVSKESDLYALAACFYEMVAGTPPFDGPNYLAQKRERVYRRLSEVDSALAPLDAVIAKALAPEAADRFHSGKELADALSAVR